MRSRKKRRKGRGGVGVWGEKAFFWGWGRELVGSGGFEGVRDACVLVTLDTGPGRCVAQVLVLTKG